jgi:hypothetical protein
MEPNEQKKLEMKLQVIRNLREYLIRKRKVESSKKELSKSNLPDQGFSNESHL